MKSMTIKESQRYRYVRLCEAYNRACSNLPSSSAEFVALSVQLHAAKGWDYIPKYMTTDSYVRGVGT